MRASVIVQVFNRREYVGECLDSLFAQTHRNFEVLLVDDASTDGTSDICAAAAQRDSRIRYIRFDENRGLRRCRRETFPLATADFVAILDSDDHAHPERLERQLRAFAETPDLVACGSRFWIQDSRGFSYPILWGPSSDFEIRWTLLFGNCWVHSAMMFRRDAVLAAGNYDERFVSGEDYELYSRVLREGSVRTLSRPLVTWRRHPSQMSTVEDPALKDLYSEIVQSAIARHCDFEIERSVARALSFYVLEHEATTNDLETALDALERCATSARRWPSFAAESTLRRLHGHALLRFWRRHRGNPNWPAVRERWRSATNWKASLRDPGFILNPKFMKPYLLGALRDLA